MSEKEKYLKKIKEASVIIDRVLAENPEFDQNDLYQIYLCLELSPEERLRKGLRRRLIYGGSYTID